MIEGYLQRRTIRNLYLIREETISVLGMIFISRTSFDLRLWLEKSAPFLLSELASGNISSDDGLSHERVDDGLLENYSMVLCRCIIDHKRTLPGVTKKRRHIVIL